MVYQKKNKFESDVATEDETPAVRDGFCGKAYKIKIFGADGEAQWLDGFFAGTLGPFHLRRNTDLIVPAEVVEALNSANEATVLTHEWVRGEKIETQRPLIRFPFQNYGEVPWDEYEKFRKGEAEKPLPGQKTN